jgi:signal transduction histidine kinase
MSDNTEVSAALAKIARRITSVLLLSIIAILTVYAYLGTQSSASLLGALVMAAAVTAMIPIATYSYYYYTCRIISELLPGSRAIPPPDEVVSGAPNRFDDRTPLARDAMAEQLQRRLDCERRLHEVDKRTTVAMLAANLAHKVGTPLNVIRGRAESLLRREQDPPKTIQGLETIINQVDKITETVKIFLALDGRREITREPHDVRQVIRSSTDLMQTFANRRRVTFRLELGDAPLIVRCDRDQLQQGFINLIRNAIDATDEQGGLIRVIARASGDGDPRVRLTFEDYGGGVPADFRPHLFDPFSASEESHKSRALALAVAQAIARDHDGQITLEPVERGSRFVMNLPLAAPDPVRQNIS